MAHFEIYYRDKKIAVKDFGYAFYIIKDGNKLRWEADQENAAPRGGVFHIWIQTISVTPTIRHEINFVRPDWRLVLDGTAWKQQFYQYVDVTQRHVELQYEDYCFICSFSADQESTDSI